MEVWELGNLFSEATRRRVQKNLRYADIELTAEEYLGYTFLLSVVLFLFALPLSPLLSLVILLTVIGTALYLPVYLGGVRSSRAERELPFFLKSLSTLLKSGIDPLTALRLASRGNPILGRSINRVLRLRRSGIPLMRAFEREAETYTSERVARSLLLVAQVIEGGYGVQSLDRYADSLVHSKRIEVREFSNKLAVFTLVFIAVTALVPSILLMYSVLLPLIFGTAVDTAVLLFVLFFIVPLVTALTLGYIWRSGA